MLVDVALRDGVERVEVPDQELLRFPRGLVGFEELTHYALFQLEPPLYLLQAVGDPDAAFVVLDPSLLDSTYRVQLPEADRLLLGLRVGERPELMCIVTLSAEGLPSTVNLRAPVALNPSTMVGAQVILPESSYLVRHPIDSGTRHKAQGTGHRVRGDRHADPNAA